MAGYAEPNQTRPPKPGTPHVRPLGSRMTLTARLTALYTLVSATVLLGLGGLTVYAVQRHFDELDQATLRDKVHLVQELGNTSASLAEFTARLHDVMHSHHGLVVSVRRAEQVVFSNQSSAGAQGAQGAHGTHQAAGAIGAAALPPAHWQTVQDTLPSPEPGGAVLTVMATLDPIHHTHFMAGFQRILWAYVALATLASGLLGWLAARNGLSPLRAMKARAQAVSAHKLDERMPVDAVPVEMADLAQSLNDMLVRLQADFERLSAFSSDLAHELRTPISNLLTETQVTLSQRRTVDDYRDALASNSEEFQRLARMVSDMLFLAKTENGLALPQPESIALEAEASAVCEFYDALAADKRLHISVEGTGMVQGDKLMVRRALSNLLSNAIRHTPEGGQVTLHIQTTPAGTQVCVANQGDAISPQVLPRLFDRFYRADAARRHPDADGAGLGLAITRAIMQAHGGTVNARSDNGMNRFTLLFPPQNV
jgi:two-component system heavy metal sensor histidine kinase CusS